jgi:hypothetical protein
MGRSNRPQAVRWSAGGLTALYRRSNRPGQSEQVFALCCIAAFVQGECALAQGELAYVQGGVFCGVRASLWWFALFA